MAIDRTVPSERNNTYTPSEVSRRTPEELFDIAFNDDQKKALLPLLSAEAGGGVLIVERTHREATAEECPNGGYATVYNHSWQEIYDALSNGTPAYLKSATEEGSDLEVRLLPINSAYYNEQEGYMIQTATNTDDGDLFIEFDDATSKIILDCGHDGGGGKDIAP